MPRKQKLPKRAAGNIPAIIDWKAVDADLEAGCLGTEIAAGQGVHPETLYDACQRCHGTLWSEYMQQKRSKGDKKLRTVQYEKAISGDNTLMIWLGKNRLKQSDNPDAVIDANLIAKYAQMMEQLQSMRSDRNIDSTNNNEDHKS